MTHYLLYSSYFFCKDKDYKWNLQINYRKNMFTERILVSLFLVAESVINQIEQIKPEHILVF